MPIAEQRGGAEELFNHFVTSMSDSPLDPYIVFFDDGPMVNQCRSANIPSTIIETGRLRDLHRWTSAIRQIRQVIRNHRADVVLSWMTKAHLYAGVASLLERTPAVWYQHGVPDPQDLGTRLATLLPATGVLACSNVIARSQASLWPNRPTVAVHPCVDTDRFDPCRLPAPLDARRQLGLPEQGPLIGMVARMQKWKGVHVFVRAMDRVRQRLPTASAVIVGGMHTLESDYVAFVDAEINRLGLSKCIHRVGFQANVPLWMQAMDVVVHASDREPFGMVILEAMALGKPVVAGAEGGPREIITDEVHGLFAPYGDDQRLAAQVYRYIDEPGLAHRISGNAPRRAADFNRSNYANRLSGALRELVSGQNPVDVTPTQKISASDTRVSSIDSHLR